MSWHEFWIFVHVVLFVYWLGADLGVLVLARRARDRHMPLEQRALLLEMAMKIDFTPRVAFVLMLPVGLQLAWSLGLLLAQPWLPVIGWSVAGLWLALVLRLAMTGGADPLLQRVQTAWLLILALLMALSALLPWLLPTVSWPAWFSGKLGLYALICLMALGIDRAFQPVAHGFSLLAADGADAARGEALIGPGINATLRIVVALYVALLAAAWLGIVQPGI